MGKERLQTNNKTPRKKLTNGLRAAGTAAFLTAGTLLPGAGHVQASENFARDQAVVLQNIKSRSEDVSNLLKSGEAKAVLISSLALSLASLGRAYVISKERDDSKTEKFLRIYPPTLFSTGTGTLLVDSFRTIPSEIPAGLLIGASFFAAAQTIMDTFERRKDPENRAAAAATAGGFIALGITSLIAYLNY